MTSLKCVATLGETAIAIIGKRFAALVGSVCILAGPYCVGAAESYPARPIKIIVPFTAGTATDTVARALAQGLTARMAQQVIVENHEGAGGGIANGIVANAPADGHVVLLATVSVVVVPLLYKESFFDQKNLAPVSILVDVPNVVCTYPKLEANTLKDLLALAKSRPGQLRYVNSGRGSPAFLTMELLKGLAKVDIEEVPYKNSSQALMDVISGTVPIYSIPVVTALPYIKAGKMRALAVTAAKRSAVVPDIPAAGETVPGYEAGTGAYGIMLPVRTPSDVVSRLYNEAIAVTRDPDFRDRMGNLGAEVVGSSQRDYNSYLTASTDRWIKLFGEIGVRPQ